MIAFITEWLIAPFPAGGFHCPSGLSGHVNQIAPAHVFIDCQGGR